MTRVIAIRLEIPDDVEVRWEGSPDDSEPVPLPEWAAPAPLRPATTSVHPGPSRTPVGGVVCPVHRVPWRTVPAGVSKKTGRPYSAFQVCPESGCDERPTDNARRPAV